MAMVVQALGDVAADGERFAEIEQVSLGAVAILQFALEHVDELGAGVLERCINLARFVHSDEERLEIEDFLGVLIVGEQP